MALLWDNWIVVAIALAAAIAALLIWLWWWVPKWQMRSVTTGDPKARADVEDNFRKTIGQAIGGLLVLFGAGAAYLQFWQQQRASSAQLQAAHALLISNQVSKGFEQLAGANIAMRLGGIYGLEGVMNDPSQQYHQPVLEALCAFVRDGTKTHTGMDPPATDIQAALTVIGRRNSGKGDVDLMAARIPQAGLFDANLRGAKLIGATLSHAHLNGADLRGAYMGPANLNGAILFNADLRGAYLNIADLEGAYLNRALLFDADLSGANLRGVHLSGARNLLPAQLQDACGSPQSLPTGFPPGFTLPPWPPGPD